MKAFLKHLFELRKTHAKENALLQNLPPSLQSQLKFERLQASLNTLSILRELPAKAAYYVSDMCEVRDVPPGFEVSGADNGIGDSTFAAQPL